jgi:hypothetical protein
MADSEAELDHWLVAVERITRFITAVRYIRDTFEPLGIPARRIAQVDIVIMESEAELRRLTAEGKNHG